MKKIIAFLLASLLFSCSGTEQEQAYLKKKQYPVKKLFYSHRDNKFHEYEQWTMPQYVILVDSTYKVGDTVDYNGNTFVIIEK